jgi:intracellular sulfur oxidation DsrE/DsrF family protein
MRYFFILCMAAFSMIQAQTPINPVITGYGTIADAPMADLKPNPSLTYNIVVDLATSDEDKTAVSFSVNQLARLINLHVMGGVPKENLNVVVAVHGGAIWTIMNDQLYREKFGVANPHTPLYKELLDNRVRVVVCSQSMFKRKIAKDQLIPGLEVATSALTTLTQFQLMGYALLRF